MNEFNYDSYCGIYCGSCDIMMSFKTGRKHPLASLWNKAPVKSYQKGMGLTCDEKLYEIKCHGCKTDALFINCRSCKIRKCAVGKNHEHCIDCNDYPCNLTGEMKKGEFLLPHLKGNHANMVTINTAGVDKWLLEQENKWKCPECHTDYSWYSKKCHNCGKDLTVYSYKFSFIQSLLLKFGIFLSSHRKIKLQ